MRSRRNKLIKFAKSNCISIVISCKVLQEFNNLKRLKLMNKRFLSLFSQFIRYFSYKVTLRTVTYLKS